MCVYIFLYTYVNTHKYIYGYRLHNLLGKIFFAEVCFMSLLFPRTFFFHFFFFSKTSNWILSRSNSRHQVIHSRGPNIYIYKKSLLFLGTSWFLKQKATKKTPHQFPGVCIIASEFPSDVLKNISHPCLCSLNTETNSPLIFPVGKCRNNQEDMSHWATPVIRSLLPLSLSFPLVASSL